MVDAAEPGSGPESRARICEARWRERGATGGTQGFGAARARRSAAALLGVAPRENAVAAAPAKPVNPDLRWYVVHAYSGMEKAVERNIRERINRALLKRRRRKSGQ